MRARLQASGAMVLLVAGGAALAEHRSFEANRNLSIGVIDPAKVVLAPTPIRPEWIIEGAPRTSAAEIAHTDDETTRVYVWQTSAARFHWNYEFDEVVQVLDGEVFVSDQSHPEKRLGPGDIAFFPSAHRRCGGCRTICARSPRSGARHRARSPTRCAGCAPRSIGCDWNRRSPADRLRLRWTPAS